MNTPDLINSLVASDMQAIEYALEAGRVDAERGFTANMYVHAGAVVPGDELKAWAWDLGWRETHWLKTEAEKLRARFPASGRANRR